MSKKEFLNGKAIVCLCLLVIGIFSVAQAQEVQGKQRKFYLSLGGSLLLISDNAFGGGNFTFGYMPSPKNLLSFEIGGGVGESNQIGNYSYTFYKKDSNGNITDYETRNDGKISYKYSSMEVMFTWNWVFNLSEKWKFRLGPTMGLLSVIGNDSYSPTSYKGVTIEGIPEKQTETNSAFMAGVVAGIKWNFAKRWFLDLNYRLSGNTPVDFPERYITTLDGTKRIESKEFGSLGNRVNLAIGVRL